MRDFMRKLILLAINLGLLGLGLIIGITRFNKYEWADQPIIDCDTDAETAIIIMSWLVWLTSAAVGAWFLYFHRKIRKNFITVTLLIAILVSIGVGVKYYRMLEYDDEIAEHCAKTLQ